MNHPQPRVSTLGINHEPPPAWSRPSPPAGHSPPAVFEAAARTKAHAGEAVSLPEAHTTLLQMGNSNGYALEKAINEIQMVKTQK